MQPDGHGLTMLPFLSGERAPGYHGEAHVTVTGINPATRAAHLVRALTRAVPYSTVYFLPYPLAPTRLCARVGGLCEGAGER